MIYLTSIPIIVCLILVVTTLGRRITSFLPSALGDSVGFYIAPVLGLAGLVLVTTVYGWLSPFKTGISLFVSLGLVLLSIKFEKRRAELFRDWLIISAFAIIVTIPILAGVIRFDSFNTFNDTFTYLVHGQWLQEHAFSEAAHGSGYFPAETQIVLYQSAGLRMGASFFLGFVQSLFHLEWSYYAYLATVGFVFSLGSLAIGGIIQQVIPVSRITALALCTLPAFSLNGFVLGAQIGFFPQTFGLTFAAGLACLIPGLIAYILSAKPAWKDQFIYLFPLALCCSAFLITYSDMFPVVGAGIGLFLLVVGWMHWGEKNRILIAVLIFSAEVMAVVNIEGVRIFRSFLTLSGVASGAGRIGWLVPWSPMQFVAHSFGMKSIKNDLWFDTIVSAWVFPLLLLGIVAILVKILRTKPRNLTVLLLVCINVIFWLAFLKFRYVNAGLEGEMGYTFLQFKLTKWLAPFNLALLGIAIAWLLVKADRYKIFIKSVFLAALATGMIIQIVIALKLTQQFQDETKQKNSSFNVLLDLRSRVANIPIDQVIYMLIPHEHHKLAQMVAYILSDRKLAARYEDGYLLGSIPEVERDMPVETADWIIQLKSEPTADENPLERVGPFLIHRAPFAFYYLESVTGGYDTEARDNQTSYWVKDAIEYQYHHIGKTPALKVKFQFSLAGNPRTLFLEVNTKTGKRLASFNIPMKGGWSEYESPIINTSSEDIVVHLSADGVPILLFPSPRHSHETKFIIQNLYVVSETRVE